MFKQKFKTIVSVILCMLMLTQGFVFASEEESTEVFLYENELKFITKLGVTNGEDFDSSAELSRSEAAHIAVKMLNYDNVSIPADSIFNDVSTSDDYFEDIMNAASLGIINGYPNAYFMPENSVTYMQFYKILISVLGYSKFADVKGGYPSGYMRFVNELELGDGIKASLDDNLKWGDAVHIIYNALNTGLCEADSVYITDGETGLDYYVNDSVTLLSRYHSIYRTQGVVTATAISSLTNANSGLSIGEIELGTKIYKGAAVGDYDKLGFNADLYYKEGNEIFFILENTYENNVQVLKDEDILDFNMDTGSYEIEKGNSIKTVSLSKTVDVIVNEKACPTYLREDMLPSCGEVCLIDNSGDGKADVVKVTSYEHYVVSGVDTVNGNIYSKNRLDTLNLNINDDDVIVSLSESEDEFSYSLLEIDTVISVAVSNNMQGVRYAKMYISRESAEGEISELASDYEYISLGGEQYFIDKAYSEALRLSGFSLIKPSKFVELKINAFGKVIYIDTDAVKGKNYGFMMDIAAPGVGLDQSYQVRILDDNGELQIYKCDKSVNVDDSPVAPENLESALTYTFTYTGGSVPTVRQLVTYEVTNEAILKEINTYQEFGTNINSIFIRGTHFGKSTRLESSAPVFVIPNDSNINTTDIETGFMVKKAGDYGADVSHKMEFFDYNELRYAGAAVKYIAFGSKSAELDDEIPLTIITSVTTAVDELGDEVPKIQGLQLGKPVEAFLYDKFITYRNREGSLVGSYTPQKNDVIAYTTDANGKVNLIVLFYRDGDKDNKFLYSSHDAGRFDGIMTVLSGRVEQFANGKDIVINSTDIIANGSAPTSITVINSKGAYAGTIADVSIGDFVLGRLRYGNIKEYVVIRN